MKMPNEGALIIDGPGGNVAAAMTIGLMLRHARMPISIPAGAECTSACVMVLAGAVQRRYGGKVGIHRPYFAFSRSEQLESVDVKARYSALLREMRSFLREMNISEQLADDMLGIEPAAVRYLSYKELQQYGLKSIDPIEQETLDLQDAQSLGLDRREYIRRQALQKTKCTDRVLQQQLGRLPNLPDFESCWIEVMKLGK
jgi:hypothetical protein